MDRNYIIDMLEGKINRMCVCEDVDEWRDSYAWAQLWLKKLYDLNGERLKNDKEKSLRDRIRNDKSL